MIFNQKRNTNNHSETVGRKPIAGNPFLFTKEGFKSNLKNSVCLLYPNWELVPQWRGLIAEGMSTYSAFESSQVSLQSDTKYSVRIIRYSGGLYWGDYSRLCANRTILHLILNLTGRNMVSFLSQSVLSLQHIGSAESYSRCFQSF